MIKPVYLSAILACLFCFGNNVIAEENSNIPSYLHKYDFLSTGFDMKSYQQCKTLIANSCPSKSPIPDCAKELVKKQSCLQLNQLSKAISSEMPFISVMKTQGKVLLVSQSFIADGQTEYSIITSTNQLLDTNINPLELDASLKQKYQKTSLLPVHSGEPKIKFSKSKHQQIIIFPMKAHENCLACKIAMSYDLQFTFNQEGKFNSVSIRNIQK